MDHKEGNKGTSQGPGVQYKPTVTVRTDRISGHGDMKMSGTKEAYRFCTKKA